jgi:tetratricopeptide (TPR) repeat protein
VISDYTEVIRIKPDYTEEYNNLGSAYLHLGQYERAIADYTEAIRLNPDGEAYYPRGHAYCKLGELKASSADLKKVKKLGYHTTNQ